MDEANSLSNSVTKLAERLGCKWEAIDKARSDAMVARVKLRDLVNNPGDRVLSDGCSVVVFGSVARGEKTSGSDIDWSLLIDGPVDPEHRSVLHLIENGIQDTFKSPDPAGSFGEMVFSHDIIHQIGGQKDTNSNITRRILLLSESCAIGSSEAYDRVLRSVLKRYLEDDVSRTKGSSKRQYNIPRFLLNDVVRYWRTMAVDYAHKRRARAGLGWATRNVKLRFSRKLIFVSGMLTCFSCHLDPMKEDGRNLCGQSEIQLSTVNHLMEYTQMSPLEVLAEALLKYASDETARDAMGAYDEFLGCIDDGGKRKHLDSLDPELSDADPLFQEMRKQSHGFQESLTKLFFDEYDELRVLTRKFGVF